MAGKCTYVGGACGQRFWGWLCRPWARSVWHQDRRESESQNYPFPVQFQRLAESAQPMDCLEHLLL